jgi:hypothetical protein
MMRRRQYNRKPRRDQSLADLSAKMLDRAQHLFDESADLDTAVRDVVYEGLAYIVYAAFDTRAVAECVSDFDCGPYIQQHTYQWFRDHEFVEWFCAGASTLFKTTPRCFFRFRRANKGKPAVMKVEKVS